MRVKANRLTGGLDRLGIGDSMNVEEMVGLLPEAAREEAKGVIQSAIGAANPIAGIDSKEKAAEWIGKNPVFKSALDYERTKAIESHSEKFMREKFPELVDAEIKKRDPNTDPVKAELAKIRSELAEEKANAKREKLLVKAMELATKEGVPTSHIKRFLEDDEDATTASVSAFIKDWKDGIAAGIEKGLKDKFGNTGVPKGGNTTSVKSMKLSEFEALEPSERAAKMKDGYTLVE
jgi:hypothetical protein